MKKKILIIAIILCFFQAWSQEYKRMIIDGSYTVQQIQQSAEEHFSIVGTERGKGYKPYKRWEYQALMNMDEDGMLKTPDFYYNELENYNNYLNQNSELFRSSTQGNWQELGPTDWNATSGWNPGVGRITSIAIEAADENHIIIGGNTGGVWRTTDGGSNWTVLTDNLSNLNVNALAMDPTDNTTYYWGANSGVIFKSTDSGATWNLLADVGSGNVNKILIDPTNTDKMYCSVQNGGIFKSTNGGANWTSIHAFASTGYDVEFKPGNTSVVYATGDKFFKSIDGGATFITDDLFPLWTEELVSGSTYWNTVDSNQNGTVSPRTGDKMAFFYIGNFSSPSTRLVSPSLDLSGSTNPEVKFSFTNVDWSGDIDHLKVLYKTSAAGSWVQLTEYTNENSSWTDITLSLPNASSDYYVAFEGEANYGRGLTLDDISVEDTTLGIVFQDGFETVINPFGDGAKMMAVSADDSNIVYILEEDGGKFGGLYKSTDSGDNYVELDQGTNNYFGYSSDADDDRGQAPRDMDIAVNPVDVDEVHIAGILSWKSTDGGTSFNVTSQWTPGNASSQNIGYCHADIDIMLYAHNKVYVGSDGGIFVAEDPSTIDTNYYTDLTAGLGIRQFYRIGVSQTDPVIVTGGSQDNGTSVMDTSGNWKDWLGADGMESFVSKFASNVLFGTSQNGGLYKSNNGGDSYNGISSPEGKSGSWVTPFEQDPSTVSTIYSGYDEVYKSSNGGNDWTSISQNFGTNLNHLKIAPSNNLIMYTSHGSSLYKTVDGGATNWAQLSGFSGSINSIAIHPSNPNKVAIATTGDQKVYVSTNGGANWTSYLLNLPNFSARALVWEDNGTDGLYLGMNYGVYYIDNTFATWQPFSNNLPNVNISELEINTANNMIYVATYGRGLWASVNYFESLSIENVELNNIKVFPNPASNEINISYSGNETIAVKIFDALGKIMIDKRNLNFNQELNLDISNLQSGVYFIKINNSKGNITKKFIVK